MNDPIANPQTRSNTPTAPTLTAAATTPPTLTATKKTIAPPPLPTVAPSEELLRALPPPVHALLPVWLEQYSRIASRQQLPPPVHALLPVWCGALNDAQESAVSDFIHHLPVSPQLNLTRWLFLRRFVLPYCAEQAVEVTPEQIEAEWDRQMARHQHAINPAKVLGCLQDIFGDGDVVIGQWLVACESGTYTLTVRRHPGNYDRIVEFLKTLEFENLT